MSDELNAPVPAEGAENTTPAEVEKDAADIIEQDNAPEDKKELSENDIIEQKAKELSQKRIDKITAQRYAEKRELERIKNEYEALVLKYTAHVFSEPDPSDFETQEEYDAKRIEYLSDLKIAEMQKAAKEAEERKNWEKKMESVGKTWKATEEKLAAEKPDYHDRQEYFNGFLDTLDKNSVSIIRDTLFSHPDKSPEVIYNLFNSPDKVEEFANMTEEERQRAYYFELFKIEQRPKEVIAVNPDPIKPISGKAKLTLDLDSLSTEEWVKHREAELRKQNKR